MILVDDGSPDRCPQMCDAFTAKDTRIKVIHQENRGAHAARKAGFEHAKGEYLVFLDPDDYLLPKALSSLYAKAIESKYDIVKGLTWECGIMVHQVLKHQSCQEKKSLGRRTICLLCCLITYCLIYGGHLQKDIIFWRNIQVCDKHIHRRRLDNQPVHLAWR